GRRFRAATRAELSLAGRVVEELERRDGLATGTLLRNLFGEDAAARPALERALAALGRAGAVALREDEFEKDGKVIRFRRVHLGANARSALCADRLLFDDAGAPESGAPAARKKKRKRKGTPDRVRPRRPRVSAPAPRP
ncbi:MAG: hypothetical protein ACJ79E_05225, partial [Anaeromyxobacteraceae bacterium]